MDSHPGNRVVRSVQVITLLPVVKHMVQLRTRFSSMIIAESNNWDRTLSLASRDKVIEGLFFWKENVERLNLRHVFVYSLPQLLVFSDASHMSGAEPGRVWRDQVPLYFVRGGTR